MISHTANSIDSKSDSLNDARAAGVEKQRRANEEMTPDWRNLTSTINKLPIIATEQNIDTIVRSIVSVIVKYEVVWFVSNKFVLMIGAIELLILLFPLVKFEELNRFIIFNIKVRAAIPFSSLWSSSTNIKISI